MKVIGFELFDVDCLARPEYSKRNKEIEQIMERRGTHRYGHYRFDYPYIMQHFNNDMQNMEILDVGCGTGTIPFWFGEQGHKVFAIDRSDCRYVMEKHQNITFCHGVLPNGVRFVKEKDWFDFVYSASVIEHNKMEKIPQILEQIEKVMKPGAKFVLTSNCDEKGYIMDNGDIVFDADSINRTFGYKPDFSNFPQLFAKFKKMFNYPYLPFGLVMRK